MQRFSLNDFQPQPVPTPVSGVDVWRIPVEVQTFKLAELAELLSSGERDHVDMATRHSGYRRFVVTRSILRIILAGYLGVRPEEISFQYGAAGKPRLGGEFLDIGLNFNLSHSGGIALVAVSRNRDVGVDIECRKPGRGVAGLVVKSLTEPERQQWSHASTADRSNIFYRYWVRKEAYLKATGTGLTYPANRVDVSFTSYGPEAAVTVPRVDGEPVSWSVYDLNLTGNGSTAFAAVAVEGLPDDADIPNAKQRFDCPKHVRHQRAKAVR